MKIIESTVKFEPITKYSKLQLTVAKLFTLELAYRYIMEATIKLGVTDKLREGQNLIDNFGKEWYVASRNVKTNEYLIKSGESIHECDGEYYLTHVSVID